MRKIFIVFVVLVAPLCSIAETSRSQEYQESLASEINQIQGALDDSRSDESDWMLKRFFLRIQLSGGFEVPLLTKFEIVPEMELVWEKNE